MATTSYNITSSIKSVLLVAVMLAGLSACTGVNHTLDLTKPLSLDMNPPPGPAAYQQGWVDGCNSGLASTNTQVQLLLATHTFTLDSRFPADSLYYRAWKTAFNHCGYSMKAIQRYNL